MTAFITQGFYGSVVLKDWLRERDGRQHIGITGKISILQDVDLVGFRAKGNESNWVARVDGETESVTILGCQVRAVITHVPDGDVATLDYLVVP